MAKAGLSIQERQLIDQLAAEERVVVRATDVMAIWGVSRSVANTALSRLAQKGWLQRLKRGSYALVQLGMETDSPAAMAAWQIAADLFQPCFISGWSAAEHWGLTDQIFNVISLVTAQPQRSRDLRVGNTRFRLRCLPEKKLFGSRSVWFGSTRVEVADPHRTMIDILDAPDFGGGGRHTLDIARAYWTGSKQDPNRILDYAKMFGRGTVFKRLGLLAEHYDHPAEEWIKRCMDGCSQGISLLDPSGPDSGAIRNRWRLRVNVPLEGG